jgi:hypothetical protein
MSGGGKSEVQTSEPSDFIKPYLVPGLDEAKKFFGESPPKHYSEGDGGTFRSAIAGFGDGSNAALNEMFRRGMMGAQNRWGAQDALNIFNSGGMGDWNTVDAMKGLGGGNAYADNPVTSRLADMSTANTFRGNPVYGELERLNAGNGMNLSKNLHGRIGDLAQTGGVDPMAARMEGLMAAGGMNHARNLFDRTSDIIDTGGDVAGMTRTAIGDITATGAGSNSQIRDDTRDLITGQAQAANPGLRNLGTNPYLNATFDKAADAVTRRYQTATAPGVDSAFAGRGRYGSGLHANAQGAAARELGDTLGGLATGIYGGAYGQERQLQEGANANLASQYLQGQGLRASTAGQSAAQAAEDARLRLQAQGLISSDMSGDLARRMAASKDMMGAESADWSNLMGGMDRLSNMHDAAAGRRMQAAQNMLGAEQQDWQNLTGNLDRMSGMYDAGAARQMQAADMIGRAYESGADRQLSALGAANAANLANRAQQLQSLGLVPQYQAMDYADLDRALGVGQARDALEQRKLDERVEAFDFGQNAPWANLQRYLALINGGTPYMTRSTTGGGSGSDAFLSALGSIGRGFVSGR